jgi:hypothetical protein
MSRNFPSNKPSEYSDAGSVRKSATHKESSREESHVQEQSLMAGSNCQAGWERWCSTDSGPGMAFIKGGGKGS